MMVGKGASLLGLRELNATTVLDVIRTHAPITRAQVARQVGLTRPTVSSALETLLEAGLVRETTIPKGQLSYGATFYELAPDAAYLVAFDVDRRQYRAVLADASGAIKARIDSASGAANAQDVVDRCVQLTHQLCAEAGISQQQIVAAVVGVPGAIDPRSGRIWLSAYGLLDNFDMGSAMTAALSVPTIVANDVNLAAIGEHASGATSLVSEFAYITIGKNVGAGILIRGDIVPGFHGAAGEIDVPERGAYVPDSPAADAFIAMAKERIAKAQPNSGRALTATPASVFAAARVGDPLALDILAEEAMRIAKRITRICQVVDVELVVLGGGIGRRCDLILDDIRAHVAKHLPFPPRVVISALEERPVLAGALVIGVRRAWAEVTSARLARVIAGTPS